MAYWLTGSNIQSAVDRSEVSLVMAAVPVSLGYGFRAGASYSVVNEQHAFLHYGYIIASIEAKDHAKTCMFF